MLEWIGTPQKRQRLYPSGHLPDEREQFTGEIVRWLDTHLGPVTLRPVR
jgi:hypothetical protein